MACRRAADLLAFCSMRLLVCVSHFRQQRFAFRAQHGHVVASDQPDDAVVDALVLMRELVAEVDDAAAVCDARKERWVESRQPYRGLADDGELTLHRGAGKRVARYSSKSTPESAERMAAHASATSCR